MRVQTLRAVSVVAAGLFGGTGVAMAAMAAHLGPKLLSSEAQVILRQGVEMQMWHALALLGAGASVRRADLVSILAVLGLTAGTVAFCAGVYALALGGVSLGPMAPTGGTVLIASWLLLAFMGLRGSRSD